MWLELLNQQLIKHADKLTVRTPGGRFEFDRSFVASLPPESRKQFRMGKTPRNKERKGIVTHRVESAPVRMTPSGQTYLPGFGIESGTVQHLPPKAPKIDIVQAPPSKPPRPTTSPRSMLDIEKRRAQKAVGDAERAMKQLEHARTRMSTQGREMGQLRSEVNQLTRKLEEASAKKGIGQLLHGFVPKAVVGTAALGALFGGAQAVRSLRERFQAKGNFERMMAQHPRLTQEDPETVKSRFRTLQRLAPNLASDPLVSGSIVSQWVEYPVVSASALKDVVGVESDVRRDLGLAEFLPRLSGMAD